MSHRFMSGFFHENYAEEIRQAQKSCDADDPLEVFFYDPAAIRLTGFFIRSGWSANAVTFLSLLFGVAGSIFLYPQNHLINILGIFLEIIAAILDCADGQVARLTHTSSQFGRVLDGAADTMVFISIYVSIGLRMMEEMIPFTEIKWSYMVWIILVAVMICHAGQARMADYFKGIHLAFAKGSNTDTVARSICLEKELSDLGKDSPLYEKVYRRFYVIYTKAQEKLAPETKRLLEAIDANGGTAPKKISEAYLSKSHKYIQLTNALTFNVRAYTLFILLLLGMTVFYFVFVLVVLEGVKIYMVRKFERIAGDVYRANYS